MSKRTLKINLNNATSVAWFRATCIIEHAVWRVPPEEYIDPADVKSFKAVSTRSFGVGGVEGQVHYNCVLDRITYTLLVKFMLPTIGPPEVTVLLKCSKEFRGDDKRHQRQIFAVNEEITQSDLPNLGVLISMSDKGKAYIAECRNGLMDYVRKHRKLLYSLLYGYSVDPPDTLDYLIQTGALNTGHPFAYPALDPVLSSLPLAATTLAEYPFHGVWSAGNAGWVARLRRAHRSILIRIVNFTSHCLYNMPEQQRLDGGVWQEYPSNCIPPLHCDEFGASNTQFLIGTSGSLKYTFTPPHVKRKKDVFYLSWSQPGLGNFNAHVSCDSKRFAVYKTIEALNEGILKFHIVDNGKMPPFRITSAYALAPISSFRNEDYSQCRVDVRAALFHYFNENPGLCNRHHIQSDAWAAARGYTENGAKNPLELHHIPFDEISLTTPRAFYCSFQANEKLPGAKEIVAHFALALEWQIACETYTKIWGPDDPVRLNSGILGGVNDAATVLASRADVQRQPFPILFYLRLLGDWSTDDSNAINRRNNSIRLSQEQILLTIFDTFRIFCHGAESTIIEKCEQKYGQAWKTRIDIPATCLWTEDVNNTENNIDLEGLLFIIKWTWDDIFKKCLADDALPYIRTLQIASTFWANQDLQHLTQELAFDVCQHSISLLKKLGVDQSAMAIDKIMRGLLQVSD